MKLVDIVNGLFEATKIEADKDAYSRFLKSLTPDDFEKLKEYGELLIDIADTQIAKNKLIK